MAASLRPSLACVEAHEQVQVLRKRNELLEAKAAATTCGQNACPAIVKGECATFLSEINDAMPTVLPRVIRDGSDVTDVKVSIDGRVLTDTLERHRVRGQPGGSARLVFEVPGEPPVNKDVVVRVGGKEPAGDHHAGGDGRARPARR